MENFSTPRVALVPHLTNLLTLAAVVGAVAWSGVHRPVESQGEVILAAPAVSRQAVPVRAAPDVLQVALPLQTLRQTAAEAGQFAPVISRAYLAAQSPAQSSAQSLLDLTVAPLVLQAASYSTAFRN